MHGDVVALIRGAVLVNLPVKEPSKLIEQSKARLYGCSGQGGQDSITNNAQYCGVLCFRFSAGDQVGRTDVCLEGVRPERVDKGGGERAQ